MNRMLALFAVAGAAAWSVFGAALDSTVFNRMCPFTFASYRGASTLNDFPVAVRLSQNITGFLYSECAANGADIRFTDDEGNLLPHEIETWNTSGESIVWVRLPALTGKAHSHLLRTEGRHHAARGESA